MGGLKFESFFFADDDYEYNQYLILAGIKVYRNEYRINKIYPGLNELIKVNTLLEDLLKNERIFLRPDIPKFKNFEVYNKIFVDEPPDAVISDSGFFFDMVKWSIPFIKDAIEEGIVLFEYVEKNINIVPIGHGPFQKDAGYIIIPDNLGHKMHVHRFIRSSDKEKKFPAIGFKTIYLQSTDAADLLISPDKLRKYLIKEYGDLPDPATYICETDLEFPYDESIFPVAKRKLREKITS